MATRLEIVTPAGQAWEGEVEQVVLPGAEGEFAALEQHERFLAPLKPGAAAIHTGAGVEWAALSSGFADVSAERVVVLVDSSEAPAAIDLEAAKRERSEAEAALAELGAASEDDNRRSESEQKLALALARIEVAGRG